MSDDSYELASELVKTQGHAAACRALADVLFQDSMVAGPIERSNLRQANVLLSRAADIIEERPILEGGQGRSANDVYRSAAWVGLCAIIASALLVVALLVGGCHGS